MFPIATVEVTYERGCAQEMVDIITRSQIANGKNYVEVGVILKSTGRFCYMHEPAVVTEKTAFQIHSDLPLILLRLDLRADPSNPDSHSGSSIGNFADPR